MGKIMIVAAGVAGGILLTGPGARLFIIILRKLPWGKIGNAVEETCATVSKIGNTKLGHYFYEPLEEFLQEMFKKHVIDRAYKGLDRDDKDKKK